MKATKKRTIVVESERAGQPEKKGIIEEVLANDPPRYRVLWEDGHTSIFAPAAGSARIVADK